MYIYQIDSYFKFKQAFVFLLAENEHVEIATKVFQFALISNSGFRFTLSHFAVDKCKPGKLLEKFWECLEWCLLAGFKYVSNTIT